MLRLRYLANKFQKRTLRVNFNQFRAQPYPGTLDATLGASGSTFVSPYTLAFTFQGGLVPGQVMVHDYTSTSTDDTFQLATGGTSPTEIPFGLLANFVGGNMDELGDENHIGVWNGVGAQVTLLAPAFNDAAAGTNGTSIASAAAAATPGNPVLLYACNDGRLGVPSSITTQVPVAQLIARDSAQVIRVRLLV
jgi:hypothetical protein